MNQNMTRLAERRERLIAQAASQRTALAQHIEPWRTPLAVADRGLAVLRFLKRHPAMLVGGGVVLARLRFGGTMTWLRRAWVSWQVVLKLLGR
jgi:hypothetical protein